MDVAVVWAWIAGGSGLIGLVRWAFDRTFAAFYAGVIGGLVVLGLFVAAPVLLRAPLFTILLALAVAATVGLVWLACPWISQIF